MSFSFLTAGESHGKALIGIIEGIPSGLEVTQDFIHQHLLRRKLGFGRSARQKLETDEVELLSGVRFGKSLGSPITLMIRNQDWKVWQSIMQYEPDLLLEPKSSHKREVIVPRPGHADLLGGFKYGHEDMRNVLERSSARETAIRVGLGSIARKFLETLGMSIASRVVRIGSVVDPVLDREELCIPIEKLNEIADQSQVRCTNELVSTQMIHEIRCSQQEGDTLGGEFEVYATGIPPALGSYVQWDRRLEGHIAQAFMSLNAVKGVEIGHGFKQAQWPGSKVHDVLGPGNEQGRVRFQSNRSGGIEGGMSTGQPIIVRAAMKPLSTLLKPLASVNLRTGEKANAHIERSDVCAVPSAAVIGESLLALVLTGAILEKFGGDSMEEIQRRVLDWKKASPIE